MDDTETTHELTVPDGTMVAQLAAAEINSLVATARAYPRSVKNARQTMIEMATLDEQAAAESMYALPRGGKPIEGPSIRFAEMIFASYGNCRVAARVTHIDRTEKYVEAEGVFLDAQNNAATMARVRRRISDKYGKCYNDDMIIVTGNAAQSIARRNAILAGIPRAVWRAAYDASRQVLMGDVKTLSTRRAEALSAFSRFGLTAEQVYKIMGVPDAEGIGLEKLVTLRGTYSALMNGEATVEELLRQFEPAKAERVTPLTASTAPSAVFTAAVPSASAAPPAPAATPAAPAATIAPPAQTAPAPAADLLPAATTVPAQAAPAAIVAATAEAPIVIPDDLLDFATEMHEAPTLAALDGAWKRWQKPYLKRDPVGQILMTKLFGNAMRRIKAKKLELAGV